MVYVDSLNATYPTNWKKLKLHDLCKINYGQSPNRILDQDGIYPVVGTSGTTRKGKDYFIDGETVIIGRKGSIDKPNYYNEKIWVIDTAFFTSDHKNLDCRWLYYYLDNSKLSRLNESTGVPSLSRATLYNLELLCPPIFEQQKISEILSTWDRAIEQVQRLIEAKQRQKKGLMQGLLTGRLRFPEFGEPVNREEDMPIGWQKFRLRELVAFYNGFGFPELNQGKSYGEIPFIKVSDMLNPGNHKYIFSSNNYVSSNTMETKGWKTAPTSSIVFAKVGEALYKNRRRILAQDTILDNNMMAIKAIPTRIADLYLYYIMLLVDFSKIAFPGALPSVNQKELGNEQIMLPGLPEQRKIISVLDRADTEIDLINNTLALLRQQKKGLMQKLLTGEIRVKVD